MTLLNQSPYLRIRQQLSMNLIKFDRSAAYLAVVLLYGLLYAQAISYFFNFGWERKYSVLLYIFSSAWLLVLVCRQGWRWWVPNRLDLLVLSFWLIVGVSIVFRLELSGEVIKYLLYVPFMVFLPYLCGRLIRISDIRMLMRTVLILGLLIIPLIAIDRFYSIADNTPLRRWPYFGYDHGRLMIGPLLAAALTAASFFSLSSQFKNKNRLKRGILYACVVFITITLVLSGARGWLISGVFGSVLVVLFIQYVSPKQRIYLITAVLTALALSHVLLLKIDAHYSNFNNTPSNEIGYKYEIPNSVDRLSEGNPVLSGESCNVVQNSDSSISIRTVLYLEAITMFLSRPFTGVGAAKFGNHSCWDAAGSYPHSTVLHVFSELGLLGGGLFLAACIVALVTFVRRKDQDKEVQCDQTKVGAFALLAIFLLSDQIYGNYFMATATWLMLGVAANVSTNMTTLVNKND